MGKHSSDDDLQQKADEFDAQYKHSQEQAEMKDNSALAQYERGIRPGVEGR